MTDPKVVPGSDVDFAAGSSEADPLTSPLATSTPSLQGLEAVSKAAISGYVKGIENGLKLFPEQARYVAWAYTVEFGNIAGIRFELRYHPLTKMSLEDGREVLRRIGGDHWELLLPLLPNSEEIDFPHPCFPESSHLKKFQRTEISHSPYINLLFLPPRARTFFAGALDYFIQESNRSFDISSQMIEPSHAKCNLPLSTATILSYAASINFKDVATYLQMLEEQK